MPADNTISGLDDAHQEENGDGSGGSGGGGGWRNDVRTEGWKKNVKKT